MNASVKDQNFCRSPLLFQPTHPLKMEQGASVLAPVKVFAVPRSIFKRLLRNVNADRLLGVCSPSMMTFACLVWCSGTWDQESKSERACVCPGDRRKDANSADDSVVEGTGSSDVSKQADEMAQGASIVLSVSFPRRGSLCLEISSNAVWTTLMTLACLEFVLHMAPAKE